MTASFAASALALSDLELLSRLNQPLNARIRLIAISQAELDSLTVKISRPEEGGAPAVEGLQQEVQQDENGHFLLVTTRGPVREPVISLIVELSWSTGHLTRQYELIIDPA